MEIKMAAFVTFVGTIHDDVSKIAEDAMGVAGYTTGTPDIRWTPEDWGRFKTSGKFRINQGEPTQVWDCDGIDVEARAITPEQAAIMASSRLKIGWNTDIYVSMDNAATVTQALTVMRVPPWHGSLETGETTSPGARLYVADYSLSEQAAVAYLGRTIDGYTIAAVQWASPESNPDTNSPQTLLTLAEANANLTAALPWWFAYQPAPPPAVGWEIIALALLEQLTAILKEHL
jgi:hypothetical protein